MSFIKKCLAIIAVLTLIFTASEIHRKYIRESVGNTVVMILNEAGTSGGTGFHVESPSGKTYIMTNSHICAGGKREGKLIVIDADRHILPRRILYDSKITDLCIVEGMPGRLGLTLGNSVVSGDIIHIIGHPKLLPTTMTSGEVIGYQVIETFDHIIRDKNDKCDLPKNEIVDDVETITKKGKQIEVPVRVCQDKIKAILTTATALHGNSGSPLVNSYGNLVGVVFAINETINWGIAIPMNDIIEILKPF